MSKTKFKAPSRTLVIESLVPIRRQQMAEKFAAVKQEVEATEKAFQDLLTSWVKENPLEWSKHVEINFYYGRVALNLYFETERNNSEGHMQYPPTLLSPFNKLEELKLKLFQTPNPGNWRDWDIKKKIREELNTIDAKSVIESTKAIPEEVPVMKEYLEQFMKTLTKSARAAERLAA